MNGEQDRWVHDLEPARVGDDEFVFPAHGREGRLMGAPVMAQSVVVAGRTVEGMAPSSVHTMFLRGGSLSEPVYFTVERLRDGRRFSTRRVTARQGRKATVTSLVTFSAVAGGIAHQESMPEVGAPEELPDFWEEIEAQRPAHRRGAWYPPRSFELRSIGARAGAHAPGELPWRLTWTRPVSPLPEDPLLHAAALVLASDTALLATVGLHYGIMGRSTSLDHAVWFHGPVRFDGWLLYASRSPAASDSRALTEAQMYTPEGGLVAAVAQETFFAR